MPSNQQALKRYIIIHNVLRRGGKHKTSRIVDICHNAGIEVTQRTIQNDLRDMAEDPDLGLMLPIEKDNNTKTYYYTEIPKNIFSALELEPEEIKALLFYAKTVSQYREYPIFNEISNAVKKVIDKSNISPEVKELFEKENILETELHPPIGGLEFITDLLDAIAKKKIIEIDYQKFEGESSNNRIKPILLKEDKQLWYVLGINTKHNGLRTYALDRIVNVFITDEEFEPIEFDSKNYFKYSFGITVLEDDPIEVVIQFEPEQGNYLKTLPLHWSQEIIEETKEKFVISIKVKPSYEFFSKIKSYGDTAMIISPESIREGFVQTFENALSNYTEK